MKGIDITRHPNLIITHFHAIAISSSVSKGSARENDAAALRTCTRCVWWWVSAFSLPILSCCYCRPFDMTTEPDLPHNRCTRIVDQHISSELQSAGYYMQHKSKKQQPYESNNSVCSIKKTSVFRGLFDSSTYDL